MSTPLPSSEPTNYWFPAKRFGFGWGVPRVWQGWVVYIGYVVFMGLTYIVFPPQKMPVAYAISVLVLSLSLIAICWLKGEPIRRKRH